LRHVLRIGGTGVEGGANVPTQIGPIALVQLLEADALVAMSSGKAVEGNACHG
jgi:hypothetical protein